MDKTENKIKDIELEKEFTRLGFDYKEMVRNSTIDDPFISFTTKIDNIDFNNSKHKVEFTFLAYNPSRNKQIELLAMNVGLFRYSPDLKKAERLAENIHWYTEGVFPTKEHVLNEMTEILKSNEIKISNGIAQAKEVFKKMNTIKQNESRTLKKKL